MSFKDSFRRRSVPDALKTKIDEGIRVEEAIGRKEFRTEGGLSWRYLGKNLYAAFPEDEYVTMTGVNDVFRYQVTLDSFRLCRADFKVTTAAGADFAGATNIRLAVVQPETALEVDVVNEAVAGHSHVYEFGESWEYMPRELVLTLNSPVGNLVYPLFTVQFMGKV